MKTVLIDAHYMPSIAWFSAVAPAERIVVEKFEHYEKQSFRNRCYIKGPHRIETLIVPVTGKQGKPRMDAVKVDYDQKWLNNHWRTIQTGYGKAPFFEYYAPDLHDVLFKRAPFLYELNLAIMTLCLKWVRNKAALVESAAYEEIPAPEVIDARGIINPKKEDGCNRFYKSIEYQQVFGSKFVPNLSLIDLIFNEGPGAWEVVKASARE
jgi:hypothetical protein